MELACDRCNQTLYVDDRVGAGIHDCVLCGALYRKKPTPPARRSGPTSTPLYEILGELGEGGFGKVYKARHTAWDLVLAVKVPRPEALTRFGVERLFAETEVWSQLSAHPNVVGCHYAVAVQGLPWLFLEYVNGGSLGAAIRSRSLYAGREPLTKLLDVAIQTARGLEHAHAQGLVHQDVKPANVLLSSDGLAKVSDFGLARVARVRKPEESSADGTATGAGFTPAYASPEQAEGDGRLTLRSDMWSWAATVLEMFAGSIVWASGPLAGRSLGAVMRPGSAAIVSMPRSVAELLAWCFAIDEAKRPRDMSRVVAELARIYATEVGAPPPHLHAAAPAPTADDWNNRGVSLWDIGRGEESTRCFSRALKLDPQHAHARYNFGLQAFRDAFVDDEWLLREVADASTRRPDEWEPSFLLGLAAIECGELDLASSAIASAMVKAPSQERQRIDRSFARAKSALSGCGTIDVGRGLRACALSTDGSAVAFLAEGTLGLWGARTSASVHLEHPHASAIAFAGEHTLVSASSGLLRRWDVTTGRLVSSLEIDCEGESLVGAPDGSAVVVMARDRRVHVVDVPSGRVRLVTGEACTAATFIDRERAIVTAHADRRLRVLDLETGRMTDVGTRAHPVHLLAESPLPFEVFAVEDWGRTRCLVSVDTRSGSSSLIREEPRTVAGLGVMRAKGAALLVTHDGRLRVVELDTRRSWSTKWPGEARLGVFALAPGGRHAVLEGPNASLEIVALELDLPRMALQLCRPRVPA